MESLLILGRQPELGIAEIESLYGPKKLNVIQPNAILVDLDPCLMAFKRLGGSIKFGKTLTTLSTTDWQSVESFLTDAAPAHTQSMPKGKMTLGLSAYGFNIEPRAISRTALNIKRAIQKTGRSIRLVPNKANELNAAQVIHNNLMSERAWELLVVRSNKSTVIAQTIMVQDIEAYSKRDQARPFRDSRVGMLPPKLAQIILNLASGQVDETTLSSVCDIVENKDQIVKLNQTIIDPFCGSGVVLQEACLMGYDVIGSDIDPRMVDYAKRNIEWLARQYPQINAKKNIFVGDATKTKWPKFNFIATETDLGKPLNKLPSKEELDNMVKKLDKLISDFVVNVSSQTGSGTRLCLAVPAWKTGPETFKHLPLIDHITDMGYNLVEFNKANTKELMYYRPNQLVARQLLTLVRK